MRGLRDFLSRVAKSPRRFSVIVFEQVPPPRGLPRGDVSTFLASGGSGDECVPHRRTLFVSISVLATAVSLGWGGQRRLKASLGSW